MIHFHFGERPPHSVLVHFYASGAHVGGVGGYSYDRCYAFGWFCNMKNVNLFANMFVTDMLPAAIASCTALHCRATLHKAIYSLNATNRFF